MDEEINIFILCWCDETGIAKPYKVVEGNKMKCPLCKNEISVTGMEGDERIMEVDSNKGDKHLELR